MIGRGILSLRRCLYLLVGILTPLIVFGYYSRLSPTGLPLQGFEGIHESLDAGLGDVKVDSPIHLPPHPIDDLITRANDDFDALLNTQSQTVAEAAAVYRTRRGRHPPPKFDQWFDFAGSKDALVVEDFFDQIYHDLAPFWGVPSLQIRQQANDFPHRISVRQGNTTHRSDQERAWMNLWSDMVRSIQKHLPDMDIPINVMDESRLVVPWEDIDAYMQKAAASRSITEPADLKSDYTAFDYLDQSPAVPFDPAWDSNGPYWSKYVVGCHPDSPARKTPLVTDFNSTPLYNSSMPYQSYHGYVHNWTLTKSPCAQPHLQTLHGTFIEPVSISSSRKLFPLFGGSKLPMNNEILLPPAMYWSSDPMYSGGEHHGGKWSEMSDVLLWRGIASGGRNRATNWRHFQRHRFVTMMNASLVTDVQSSSIDAPNFILPDGRSYGLEGTDLGHWLSTFSNVSFTGLLCFPRTDNENHECDYTSPHLSLSPNLPMAEQYMAKYLPDIDGNSFSGRYRAWLSSSSVPLKATIYAEWHDSRLVPWRHFVPLDNTFVDLYGVMKYFLGDEGSSEGKRREFAAVGIRDDVAERIAFDGKSWAGKVLRKEDMQVYVYRLLLEYARICDDERDRMGWADDLK